MKKRSWLVYNYYCYYQSCSYCFFSLVQPCTSHIARHLNSILLSLHIHENFCSLQQKWNLSISANIAPSSFTIKSYRHMTFLMPLSHKLAIFFHLANSSLMFHDMQAPRVHVAVGLAEYYLNSVTTWTGYYSQLKWRLIAPDCSS